MTFGKLNAETLLSRIGLSVRAMNICVNLGCETVGELAQVFQHKGADFVMGRRNCGMKTLAELSALVDVFSGGAREPQFAFVKTSDIDHDYEAVPLGFTAAELLEAAERLQIPYGLPLELIRLPIRIRNWCDSHEWNTLGKLLQNTGGMGLGDFLAVDNLGKKSATEVLKFFAALKARSQAALRQFLPLAPNTTAVALPQALDDLVTSLDDRDARILEMRLVEGSRLEAIARNFNHTRELVRQIEGRFMLDVERVLNWFSDERVELWQAWESTGNLTSLLAEKGVTIGTILIAAAVSSVFENTPEGKLLHEHWRETFRNWGRELMASECLLSDGVDLAEFAKDRGDPDLACRFQAWVQKNFGNGLSVVATRVTRLRQELTTEQRALLFGGESIELRWRSLYERLKQYYADHGHADVPSGWKADRQLAAWVSSQRERRKKGVMLAEEFALLNELGLTWQSRDVGTWEDRLAEVTAFKARHGHCEIPTVFAENPKLGRFVNAMRTQRNACKLSAERIAKLDAIGFVWASTKKAAVKLGGQLVSGAWKTQFDELVAYKKAHGDCDVPAKWEENERLANWVSMQRQAKKRDALPEARVKLLDEIGFNWRADFDRQPWDVRYGELLRFKEAHSHCNVPVRNPDNPALGAWVVSQRSNRKRGKLTAEQEKLLNDADFIWQAGNAQKSWETRYAELLQFKEAYGHCNVSARNPVNPSLGTWVAGLRINKKRGKLTIEQERMLSEIGFVWQAGIAQKSWESRYAELLQFKEAHGHCDVSVRDPENPSLGFWVFNQRTNRKSGKLTIEQVRLLDEVGFRWERRSTAT
jgi:hypothetical protein